MTITTIDMRVLETNTVALGIPLRLLMEAAGKSIADVITNNIPPDPKYRIVVLMGKGGNGGDALVASRYLSRYGYTVEIVPAYSPSEIEHPDTCFNYEIIKRLPSIKIHKPGKLEIIENADIIIDGLLGTGVKGELREPIRSMVEKANSVKSRLKIAIDTPTGLNPDTGEIHGIAFKADITVTFHDIKPGLEEKVEYTGKVIVANIGIPREAWTYVGPGDVIHRIPKRKRDTHKGMAGKILVIGGSIRFTGAPALAGLAALAAGADLVYIVSPEPIRGIIASYSPELITLPCKGNYFSIEDIPDVLNYIDILKPHVILIGPGLGDRPETIEAVKKILLELIKRDKHVVVDADGLKAIKVGEQVFDNKVVITPHRGEFKRITGKELTGDLDRDSEIVAYYASKLKTVILLKAPIDIISNGIITRYNKTGNPYMSIGGTGDVLSGLTATFLAQTKNPFVAACIASYVNGLAGDYLFKKNKKVSPMNMIRVIPRILYDPLNIHLQVYNDMKKYNMDGL